MMFSLVELSLLTLLLSGLVTAHELCADFSAPHLSNDDDASSANFEICRAYREAPYTCLLPSEEAMVVQARVQSALQSEPQTSESYANCKNSLEQMWCAEVDAWSAHLFDTETSNGEVKRTIPWLCESFGSAVYDACREAIFSAGSNPFMPNATNDGALITFYPTKQSFLENFATTTSEYCFNGQPYIPPEPILSDPSAAALPLCVEAVAQPPPGSYDEIGNVINFASAPGRPDFIVLGTQLGRVIKYQINKDDGSFEEKGVLLDISSGVLNSGSPTDERGLLSIAFHKDFVNNGRFFLSYVCRMGGNSDDNIAKCPEEQSTMVAEYKMSNPNATVDDMKVDETAAPRTIFTLKQPQSNHNGGQILFTPHSSNDANLFLFLGDGGGSGDRANNAQNVQTFLGKVLRLDIDSEPDPGKGYKVPEDNPFVQDDRVLPEIWALGLRNPWRCSFDRQRASYLFCADVGQNKFEEVNLVRKGGNYGWNRYEADGVFRDSTDLSLGRLPDQIHIPPILSYPHEFVHGGRAGPASVTGGYVYRPQDADSALVGKYIFADLYGVFMVGTESPADSGLYGLRTAVLQCSETSPLPCDVDPEYRSIYSFGEDELGNVYFLSWPGVYKFVEPSLCGINETVYSMGGGGESVSTGVAQLGMSLFTIGLAVITWLFAWE